MRARVAVALLALLAALLLLAPTLPEPGSLTQLRLWAYGSHAVYFGALCAAVALLVSVREWPTRRLVAATLGSFVVVMVLNRLDVDVASDVAKVLFGTFAGAGLVRAIERPWWLVPICVCVPLADAWSVFSSRGVTHAVVQHARKDPTWIDWPTVATPIAGFDYASAGRIGIVDVMFTAIFLAAAARWDLGLRRCAALIAVGFVGTTVLVFQTTLSAVPALPLLCIAFLLGAAPGLWRDLRAASRGH
ncbi:MAG: hypothetical protein JWM98_2502 [Thermoleophilia bacterium]|nr:hypothetical protein [Thermoleophilia bacterium]